MNNTNLKNRYSVYPKSVKEDGVDKIIYYLRDHSLDDVLKDKEMIFLYDGQTRDFVKSKDQHDAIVLCMIYNKIFK